MPNRGMPGHKNWVCVLNNPAIDDCDFFTLEDEIVQYAVWQHEVGAKNGTPHLQGYVQFTDRKSLATVKDIYPTAHWEIAQGDAESNKKYCTKDETRDGETFEIGVMIIKGQRTDILVVRKAIEDGVPEKVIAHDYFSTWVRCFKAFERYRFLVQPKREWPTQVIVLTGPTGCGKSRYIHSKCLNPYRQCNKDWFTHYSGEEDVIMDEFYGSRFSYSYLLQLLDRYPFSVGTKGNEVNFIPKRIWLTSNKMPWQWYENMPQAPLMRRITLHVDFLDEEQVDTSILDALLLEHEIITSK